MSKMIEEKTELTKMESGYKYHSYGIIELTEEDFERNSNVLIRNVVTIKDYLEKYEQIKEANWLAKKQQLDLEYKAAQEAYEHFDESVAKLIEDITSKKEEKRNIIKMYIDGFEDKLKTEKEKVEKMLENQKNNFELQLKNDEPMLEIYKKANEEKVNQKMEEFKKELEEKNKKMLENSKEVDKE